jgi:hypothetical protein
MAEVACPHHQRQCLHHQQPMLSFAEPEVIAVQRFKFATTFWAGQPATALVRAGTEPPRTAPEASRARRNRRRRTARMSRLRLLEDGEDDPTLSVVNLIDVFLVLVAALLLAMAQSPFSPAANENYTLIRNPGQPDMQVIVKQGEKIERYESTGNIGAGEGRKAGVAYMMKDGSMVYVPEGEAGKK